MRQVVLYPGEDRYWVVESPGLIGYASKGLRDRKRVLISRRRSLDISLRSRKMGYQCHETI